MSVVTRRTRMPMTVSGVMRRMPVTVADTGDFTKSMGLWQLVALSLGGLVGAGVFSLAGVVAHDVAGPGVLVSFLIAIIASGAAGLCYATSTSPRRSPVRSIRSEWEYWV